MSRTIEPFGTAPTRQRSEETPEVLYHYTSISALLGILDSGSVWATDIHFLNDEEEFTYAVDRSRSVLSNIAEDATDDREKAVLNEAQEKLTTIENVSVCVFSLSEDPNVLSQWRAYCPTAQGVAIGFDTEMLGPVMDEQDFRLVPCVYSDRDHVLLLRNVVAQTIKAYRNGLRSEEQPKGDELVEKAAVDFLQRLIMVAPTIKHRAFAEEKEWRLVSNDLIPATHPKYNVRTGPSMVIPHFEFDLELDDGKWPIDEVYLGPTPNTELAMDGIMMALEKYEVGASVVASQIPYREW